MEVVLQRSDLKKKRWVLNKTSSHNSKKVLFDPKGREGGVFLFLFWVIFGKMNFFESKVNMADLLQ